VLNGDPAPLHAKGHSSPLLTSRPTALARIPAGRARILPVTRIVE